MELRELKMLGLENIQERYWLTKDCVGRDVFREWVKKDRVRAL